MCPEEEFTILEMDVKKFKKPEYDQTLKRDIVKSSKIVESEIMVENPVISKEDLPHIFDKFYRSKEAQIAGQIGSGLGLAMTAEIIHLHGGEIEVQSEPGQGTEFNIFIPKEEFYLGE